uniref:hypothetical protein n=1 Tax=Paenibacillus abyssi TaxID=1340531 RepID=UPI00366C682A
MTAGNLATTQAVISQLEERNKAPSERHNSLLEAPTMFKVASIVGNLLQDIIEERAADNGQKAAAGTFSASMIVAGQIKGMEPRLFLIYPKATSSRRASTRRSSRSARPSTAARSSSAATTAG